MLQKINSQIIFYDNGKKFIFIGFNYKIRRQNLNKLHYF